MFGFSSYLQQYISKWAFVSGWTSNEFPAFANTRTLAATKMSITFKHTKIKIAFHSFGVLFFFVLILVLSTFWAQPRITPYLITGLMTGEILRIIFSRKKYLISISENEFTVSVNYLNRMLIQKKAVIEKQNLSISDVTETNWWLGRVDYIKFDNTRQFFTFDCIDKKVRQSVSDMLDVI